MKLIPGVYPALASGHSTKFTIGGKAYTATSKTNGVRGINCTDTVTVTANSVTSRLLGAMDAIGVTPTNLKASTRLKETK